MVSIIVNSKAQGQETPILTSYGIYKKYTGSTTYANININLSITRGKFVVCWGQMGQEKQHL